MENFQHETGLYEVLASRRNPEDLAHEIHVNEGPSSFPWIDVLVKDVRKNRLVVAKIGWELDGRDIEIETATPDVSQEEMVELLVTDGHDALMLAMDRSQALIDASSAYYNDRPAENPDPLPTF